MKINEQQQPVQAEGPEQEHGREEGIATNQRKIKKNGEESRKRKETLLPRPSCFVNWKCCDIEIELLLITRLHFIVDVTLAEIINHILGIILVHLSDYVVSVDCIRME